jgi:hypothetical protein
MVKSDGKIHALGRAHIGVLAYFVWALPPNAEGTAPMRSNPIEHGERERMKNFLGQEGVACIHGPL